jgi:hypothetical protein
MEEIKKSLLQSATACSYNPWIDLPLLRIFKHEPEVELTRKANNLPYPKQATEQYFGISTGGDPCQLNNPIGELFS